MVITFNSVFQNSQSYIKFSLLFLPWSWWLFPGSRLVSHLVIHLWFCANAASHSLLADQQHRAHVAFLVALTCLCVCENPLHIVKVSRHLLVEHGFLIKWNIFLFTALDYALLHSLSAANNSDNLVVHRFTVLITWWWTPVLQLSHYSIILF